MSEIHTSLDFRHLLYLHLFKFICLNLFVTFAGHAGYRTSQRGGTTERGGGEVQHLHGQDQGSQEEVCHHRHQIKQLQQQQQQLNIYF